MAQLTIPDWMFERDSSPEPLPPPEPPSANSLSIPDEAFAASTAYAMDPTLPLGPNDWDEVDRANAARVDELNNEFIDLRDGILHDGDDAFFKQTGRDAVLAAPQVHAKLETARQETLGRAANDVQRDWLRETLGKHKIVEHFDIGDHVGRQSVAWQKSINRGRLDRLNRQAGRDHGDPKMVEALANSSESSARDHARASGLRPDSPEAQAEVDIARSSVFRHAIEAALAKGAHSTAIKLHDRARGKLVPGDAELLDKLIEDACEMKIGKDYVARIAPPSTMTNRSVADLDEMQAEVIARNNEDWKSNDRQRATNQHLIKVQFGEARRQVKEDKAKLVQTVHDWLVAPRADGRPQTARPPIAIWARLTADEQKDVDTALELNAEGSIAGSNSEVLQGNAAPGEAPIGRNTDATAREKPEDFSPADIVLAQASGSDGRKPELSDDTVKELFTKEFQDHPDFKEYLRLMRSSPTMVRDLNEIARRQGKVEFGKREKDGSYNKGTYYVKERSYDQDGMFRETPVVVIAPNHTWTVRTKEDGTNLYPNDIQILPRIFVTEVAHEIGHALRERGTPNTMEKGVESAGEAVALTLLGEGVAILNEYDVAKEMGLGSIYSGTDLFITIAEKERKGKVDPKFVGEFRRNRSTSTYGNLTYEQMAVIQWIVGNKLKKNWWEFDWRAIEIGKTLHIKSNGDGTYSVKGEVPYLPKNGRKRDPLPINEPRA